MVQRKETRGERERERDPGSVYKISIVGKDTSSPLQHCFSYCSQMFGRLRLVWRCVEVEARWSRSMGSRYEARISRRSSVRVSNVLFGMLFVFRLCELFPAWVIVREP